MLSKHPLELPKDRTLSKDELADALRLSIIAELDAINLYLQLARASGDEAARKVFEDVAREEKTHVGEFLALLKNLDPEQVEELKHGFEEVGELTGVKPDPDPQEGGGDPLAIVEEAFKKTADASRVLRKHIPIHSVGRGVDYVSVERVTVSGDTITSEKPEPLPLEELSVKFSIPQRTLDRLGGRAPEAALFAAARLAASEDSFILDRILSCKEAETFSASDWSQGGAAVRDVAEAIKTLSRGGVPGPYLLVISPEQYSKLVMVHERTGVMELTRVKQLVQSVVQLPQMPGDTAILLSARPSMIDLVIGADTVVEYIGPEDGSHLFRAWETLALRIKYPRAIVTLKFP